jgi:hypothetical protein
MVASVGKSQLAYGVQGILDTCLVGVVPAFARLSDEPVDGRGLLAVVGYWCGGWLLGPAWDYSYAGGLRITRRHRWTRPTVISIP